MEGQKSHVLGHSNMMRCEAGRQGTWVNNEGNLCFVNMKRYSLVYTY